jgi:hypothetical protein
MIIYCIILFFGVLFYNENRSGYKLLSVLTLILLGIFREKAVGTDYVIYIEQFNQKTYSIWEYDFNQIILSFNSEDSFTKQLEPLWYALNYSVDFIGGKYSLVNLVSLLIVLGVYIFAFHKNSKNPSFSLLLLYTLFYYFMAFNTVRQSIALAFILLCYYYYDNKKWLYSVLTFLLAVGFHYSAVFALIIILMPFIKIKKNFSYILLAFSLLFGSLLSGYLINLFSFNTIYNFYTDFKWGEINVMVSRVFYLLQCLLYYFTTRNVKTKYLDNNFTKIWFWGLIMQNIFIEYIVFHRLVDYLLVAQLIAIPFYLPSKLSFNFNNFNKNLLIILILIILIFAFNMILNRQGVIPYEIMEF